MRELETARAELLATISPLPSEQLPLAAASGRILAESPSAPHPLPPFDNSSLDGYAVRAADLRTAPTVLRVIAAVAAGGWFGGSVGPGEAVRVFTGAPLPHGADAVVMQEDTSPAPLDSRCVQIDEPVKPWENLRFRGEDVPDGAVLLPAGPSLGPGALGLLAAVGVVEVRVHRKPRVAIVATGSELVPAGTVLGPGQIHESNTLMLAELIRQLGATPVCLPLVPDHPDATSDALRNAFASADLVLTVGGASVGEHDLVKPALLALGGQLEFWRLAIKPGKPFFLGRLGNQHLLGLPGNPVSAFVTAVLMVLPAIRRLQGVTHCLPPQGLALLKEQLTNADSRRHFVRVATDPSGTVRASGLQASHRLASLAVADGLVDVAPRCTLAAGTLVPVIRWQ
jgi:molybdopterin molybdotransferase